MNLVEDTSAADIAAALESGHMRFILGDQDWVLGPGEVASFDAKVPPLVRQHRRRTRGDPQHLRTTRRTNDRPDDISVGLEQQNDLRRRGITVSIS